MDYIEKARAVIDTEINGLSTIKRDLGEPFVQLVKLCLKTLEDGGKIVISGIGKSGHIGRKMASTLASTGSPAAFMHPVEAMHGDLGIVNPRDILLALSYSGETEELLAVLPGIRRFGIPIVSLTGNAKSQLAEWSDLVVPMAVPEEACPFNLAPTTSTTALLALGDALAIVLLEAQDFSKEDYGRFHPAGAIGRSVTLSVKDIMRHSERFAVVDPEATVKDTLLLMTQCRSGSAVVVDKERKLLGIFTDGDFRRHIQERADIFDMPIQSVMTANPVSVDQDIMAVEILRILEKREIDDIPVVNGDEEVVGMVDIQDLAKFKLM